MAKRFENEDIKKEEDEEGNQRPKFVLFEDPNNGQSSNANVEQPANHANPLFIVIESVPCQCCKKRYGLEFVMQNYHSPTFECADCQKKNATKQSLS